PCVTNRRVARGGESPERRSRALGAVFTSRAVDDDEFRGPGVSATVGQIARETSGQARLAIAGHNANGCHAARPEQALHPNSGGIPLRGRVLLLTIRSRGQYASAQRPDFHLVALDEAPIAAPSPAAALE